MAIVIHRKHRKWDMNQKHTNELVKLAFAIESEEAKEAGAFGFMARVLTQATFPYRSQPDCAYTRHNGLFSLSIMAPPNVGLPYGSYPRLLLSWVTTEAVRTHNPVLELGSTLSAFMNDLGLVAAWGQKGTVPILRNQMKRLFSSTVSCQYEDKNNEKGASFNIADNYDLWWSPKIPNQLPLWKSTVTLGTGFFKEIIEKPVPINLQALKTLKRSPLALDIYCWLTHRMSYLRKETEIPWTALQLQFGADYALTRQFKAAFLKQLKVTQKVYSEVKVEEGKQGLILKPSPPHVVPKSKPSRASKTSPSTAVLLPSPNPEPANTPIKTETYEKARQAASGFDVYALEQDWREWIAKKGERPKNPDSAFIGFCRQKARLKTG